MQNAEWRMQNGGAIMKACVGADVLIGPLLVRRPEGALRRTGYPLRLPAVDTSPARGEVI